MQSKTILTPLQKQFLEAFFRTYLAEHFFLTGGTALAEYYLSHRLSEDLDLFTIDQSIDFAHVSTAINKLVIDLHLRIERQVSSPAFLQYILLRKTETLKVDVVKDVPIYFGKIRKVDSIRVDSLKNVSVGKLLAVFGRAAPKDFIDIYFLLKEKHISFQTMYKLAKKKDLGLHEFYLAEMLSRVQDVKEFPRTIKPFDKKDLVEFFLNLSQTLYKKIKPKE